MLRHRPSTRTHLHFTTTTKINISTRGSGQLRARTPSLRPRMHLCRAESHTESSHRTASLVAASAATNLQPPGPYFFSKKAANAALSAALSTALVAAFFLPRPPPQLPPPRPRPLKMTPRQPRPRHARSAYEPSDGPLVARCEPRVGRVVIRWVTSRVSKLKVKSLGSILLKVEKIGCR